MKKFYRNLFRSKTGSHNMKGPQRDAAKIGGCLKPWGAFEQYRSTLKEK
jgi:hypothetical protein